MKIPLDKSNGEFEKQDLIYIKILEADEAGNPFEKLTTSARKECGIKNRLLKCYPTAKIFSVAQKYAKDIVFLYGLPNSWIHPISNFIVMGKFTSPHSGIYMFGLTRAYPSGRVSNFEIIVMQEMSWFPFLQWIHDNRKTIEESLAKLPKKNNRVNISPEKLKLKLLIFRLRKEGLEPSDIERILRERYEKDIKLYDSITTDNISRWVSEFDKRLHRKPLK